MMSTGYLFFLVLLPIVSAHGGYAVQTLKLGSPVLLDCTEEGYTVEYWLEPSREEVLYPGQEYEDIGVSENGTTLYIPRLAEGQLGDYVCILKSPNDTLQYRGTTVLLHQPATFEVSRMNLIVVATSAGVFLLLCAMFCCACNRKCNRTTPAEEDKACGSYDLQITKLESSTRF